MEVEEIKKRMKAYRDFYGGDFSNVDDIDKATTKQELEEIIEKHRSFMDDMLSDAHNHLDRFKERLGLTLI